MKSLTFTLHLHTKNQGERETCVSGHTSLLLLTMLPSERGTDTCNGYKCSVISLPVPYSLVFFFLFSLSKCLLLFTLLSFHLCFPSLVIRSLFHSIRKMLTRTTCVAQNCESIHLLLICLLTILHFLSPAVDLFLFYAACVLTCLSDLRKMFSGLRVTPCSLWGTFALTKCSMKCFVNVHAKTFNWTQFNLSNHIFTDKGVVLPRESKQKFFPSPCSISTLRTLSPCGLK